MAARSGWASEAIMEPVVWMAAIWAAFVMSLPGAAISCSFLAR